MKLEWLAIIFSKPDKSRFSITIDLDHRLVQRKPINVRADPSIYYDY